MLVDIQALNFVIINCIRFGNFMINTMIINTVDSDNSNIADTTLPNHGNHCKHNFGV